ncbi:MAG: type II toxin-antitoxin system VapC family toxin [Gemmatimonadetes bacterium]|nr:type II toxin-antitoxin system VapC family toxin [Gemmatimonadota bacterium]
MITALDSSVLLDVLANDPRHGAASFDAIEACRAQGRLIVSPIVWAEVRAFFDSGETLRDNLRNAGISFDPIDEPTADLAGVMWKEYRRRGGKRERLLPDFLVAAHAKVRAERFLTRDRGFFLRYFRGLEVIEPGS